MRLRIDPIGFPILTNQHGVYVWTMEEDWFWGVLPETSRLWWIYGLPSSFGTPAIGMAILPTIVKIYKTGLQNQYSESGVVVVT